MEFRYQWSYVGLVYRLMEMGLSFRRIITSRNDMEVVNIFHREFDDLVEIVEVFCCFLSSLTLFSPYVPIKKISSMYLL